MPDKESNKKLCRLFEGGSCPFCDDEHELVGISYEEAQEINAECCENSYIPSCEEFEEMVETGVFKGDKK